MGTNGNDSAVMLTPVMLTPQEQLQARMADPRTIESLNALLDKLDVMAFTVNALDGFLRRGDEVVDSLASGLDDLKKMAPADSSVVQLAGKLPQLAKAGVQLADSYGDTIDKPHKAVGLGGLLKALGDPDIQRSLGLLLDFAKRFGQKINA